ncbi:hypothetical protein R1sor_007813 [Riccia sorocarpa]|uniref:Translation initiation factor IF-3 n=1 Tax=Riccia sorocarpa TaxID=122646 RepID=A0ABD3HUE5_9MARC
MNRGAWRRVMRIGREWAGRSHGGGGGGNQKGADRQPSSPDILCFETLGIEIRSELQRNFQVGGSSSIKDLSRWGNPLVLALVRNYAAPISRVGKAPANPARQQKANPDAPPEPEKPERKINRAIVARQIRLITDEGHVVVSRMEALRRAEDMDMDLVEVDGKQDPPVCKLMDFNKERFKDRQREKEMKRKQVERRRLDDLKEVRFSTRTEPNDLELKAQMAKRLLLKGHRVKLAVVPHGNDDVQSKGRELIQRMVTMLQETSKVETGPRIEKQRAWVLVRPVVVAEKKGSNGKKNVQSKSDSSGGEDEVQSPESVEDEHPANEK